MNSPEYRAVCLSARINHVPLKRGLMVLLETASNFPRVAVVKSVEALEKELDNLSLQKGEAESGLSRQGENGVNPRIPKDQPT
jgi:hypothetical protein